MTYKATIHFPDYELYTYNVTLENHTIYFLHFAEQPLYLKEKNIASTVYEMVSPLAVSTF